MATAAQAHLRQVTEIIRLCQQDQTSFQTLHIRLVTQVDIAETRAEESASVVILEVQLRSRIHNDIAALTGIDR